MNTLATTSAIELQQGGIRLVFDPQTNHVTGLYGGASEADWISHAQGRRFGVPFVAGTQQTETDVMLTRREIEPHRLIARSESRLTTLTWTMREDHVHAELSLPPRRGPRSGLSLDLDMLDLPDGNPWRQQVMPIGIHVADDLAYAWFIFHRADDDLLLMVVDGPLAAWRIRYSYLGHRMDGFQVLTEAQDVVPRDGTRLPVMQRLSVKLAFASSMDDAWRQAAKLARLAMAVPAITGGYVGSRVGYRLIGHATELIHLTPAGEQRSLPPALTGEVTLGEPGLHRLAVRSADGSTHVTRLFAHEPWHAVYDRVNHFYRDHFQHECGAFFAAIHTDSLQPDGLTFEGRPFGDPNYPNALRSGEFGGFCGWAMLKNMLLFGQEPSLRKSVDRYLLHWGLNRGHEDQPFNDTMYKRPAEHRGMKWSAYHLYKEVNFAQSEVFFLNQMIDYVRLTNDPAVLDDAVGLAKHFISDHVKPDGMVCCRNSADSSDHDYTTVEAPLVALVRLWHLLRERGHADAGFIRQTSLHVADYLLARGLDFATEGEPCTEDGSFACAAWSLLHAYLELEPRPRYMQFGMELLRLHAKLEMRGLDCRMNQSTIRFWETQYETDTWGPSINAGHGWSLWTAMAKFCAYRITRSMTMLQQSYEAFLTSLSKIDVSGGMYSCYTPDMIPGTPHQWCVPKPLPIGQDTQQTTIPLGWGYPTTYAASGNHVLIQAAETWAHTSGVNVETNATINGMFDDKGVFVSAAPHFSRLAISAAPRQPMKLAVTPGRDLVITLEHAEIGLELRDADVLERLDGEAVIRCRPTSSIVTLAAARA
ncbi:MAG: hypothetical protein IT440_10745 [Phycisphaeraceae bacterium]|nr:hypothetical protein [Phycisphaeraceae bacterium]